MSTATLAEIATHAETASHYEGFEQMLIAGRWRSGRSRRELEDRNPFTEEVLLRIKLADKSDLDDAYRAAADAQPGWAAMLPMERANVLRRAAQIMEMRK